MPSRMTAKAARTATARTALARVNTKAGKQPAARTTRTRPVPTAARTMPARPAPKGARAPAARMSFAEAMAALERAGSEQTKRIYRRHGASEPLFGVSFAALKTLVKQIRVDHELALALWGTGNFDAQNLAAKIVDPARMSGADLDRWARSMSGARTCSVYVGMVAAEGPHARAKAAQWSASRNALERRASWSLMGQLAERDETIPDAYFEKRLAEIEKTIHAAPNDEREGMNMAVIVIGCRNAALRRAALAAAKRIGKVVVDHGETGCKTPDAAAYIEKCWAHSKSKGFDSPAAQERMRESPRTRC
jgi:3-methyladenine DNA glycosylase AlkD